MAREMKLLREPLIHFLALGAALFLLYKIVAAPVGDRSDRIVVTSGHIERLVEGWARTWQRPPTRKELEGLIEDHIREEILYREALAMGLDRDDTIIRRRLRQKMEFLIEDLDAQANPSDEELQAFLDKNPDAFRVAPRVTFSHIYLNRDRRGESATRDAKHLLARLEAADGRLDAAALGDPLLLPHDYESLPEDEVAKLFGREFAARLTELPADRWTGPVESGYGLHLVLVRERTEGRVPKLTEVRDAVRREWLAVRRHEANEALHQRLRVRYTVIVERPEWASGGTQGSEAQ